MKGGVTAVGRTALTTDYVLGRPVAYENIVDDGTPGTPPRSRALGSVAMFTPFVRGGAVGASVLSRRAAVDHTRQTQRRDDRRRAQPWQWSCAHWWGACTAGWTHRSFAALAFKRSLHEPQARLD